MEAEYKYQNVDALSVIAIELIRQWCPRMYKALAPNSQFRGLLSQWFTATRTVHRLYPDTNVENAALSVMSTERDCIIKQIKALKEYCRNHKVEWSDYTQRGELVLMFRGEYVSLALQWWWIAVDYHTSTGRRCASYASNWNTANDTVTRHDCRFIHSFKYLYRRTPPRIWVIQTPRIAAVVRLCVHTYRRLHRRHTYYRQLARWVFSNAAGVVLPHLEASIASYLCAYQPRPTSLFHPLAVARIMAAAPSSR